MRDEQNELPWDRTHARNSDPSTSKRAAARVSKQTRESQKQRLMVGYDAAGRAGLTDERAGQLAALDESHKRCADLRRELLIVKTDVERETDRKRDAMVCVAWQYATLDEKGRAIARYNGNDGEETTGDS